MFNSFKVGTMQNATVRPETKWKSPRLLLPTPRSKFLGALSVLIGIAIVVTVMFVWTTPAMNLNALFSNSQVSPGNAPSASVADQKNDLVAFERYIQNLADSNSPEAFPILVQSLKQSEPLSRRSFVLTALKDASPAVVPALTNALKDSDTGVRAGAVQALGMRREYQAIAALSAATRDSSASVRREAVTSLGSLNAWEALPRLEQLQVNETDYAVRQVAIAAKESFKNEIAQAIGVPASELRDISVTTGNLLQIYAVTTNHLYALYGTASWTLVSRLPDAPLAIATGADPGLIYLATVSSGLFRSFDGGETWEHVQFGLQTPTQLTVTAVVVDPQDSRQFFIALAAQSAKPGVMNSMGVFTNKDGGATWSYLPNSPTASVTTRLVIDPQERSYLFGMTSDTPWRYTLPIQACDYCLD